MGTNLINFSHEENLTFENQTNLYGFFHFQHVRPARECDLYRLLKIVLAFLPLFH